MNVSFSDLERIVGKLVSLECAVPAGMWYIRFQHKAMKESGISPDSLKSHKK